MLATETPSIHFRFFDKSFTANCTNVDELREQLHNFIPGDVPIQCIWDDMEIRLDDPAMMEFLLEEYSKKTGARVLSLQIEIRIGREDLSDDLVELFVGSFEDIKSAASKILSRDDYSYDITLEDGSLISNELFDCVMLSEGRNVVTLTNIEPILEEAKERDAIHSELRQWLRSALNSLPNDLLSALCAAFTSEGITTVALLKSLAANGRSEVLDLCSDIAKVRSVRQRGFLRGHKTRLVEAILALAGSEAPRDQPFTAEAGLEGWDELKSAETGFDRPQMSDPSASHGIKVSLVPLPRADRSLTDPSEGSISLADSANLNVQIEIPETLTRLAPDEVVGTDVVCVVDVSGSMSQTAPAGPDGKDNKDGLSILDLVKHALKTVIGQLDGSDRFALVSFSTTAKRVFALEGMNATGRERALIALESMRPNNSTNIWAGLLQGMEAIRECDEGLENVLVAGPPGLVEKTVVARRKTVMLLTDGMPNCEPPKGHLAELKAYLDKYPGFNFQLNTFGFGYGLNSDLLSELATEGGGTFAFIPDALIVGTVFVNTMANALSTFSQTATLNLIPKNGATMAAGLPGFKNACAQLHEWIREGERAEALVAEESWGFRVKLGPLQLGQTRTITVPLNGLERAIETPEASLLEAVLQFPDPVPLRRGPNVGAAPTVCNVSVEISVGEVAEPCSPTHFLALPPPVVEARKAAAIDVLRNEVVAGIAGAIWKAVRNDGESATADMDAMGKNLDSRFQQLLGMPQVGEVDEEDARLVALKADVKGRSAKALQGMERFKRWGKHYLLAIARAHELRTCTNFMDPGLQVYGGERFRDLRAKGDEMFLALPPPMPMRGSYRAGSYARSSVGTASVKTSTPARAAPPKPKVDMSGYYQGLQGGCFGGKSTITRVGINGEETVHVRSIRAFDRIRMADGSVAVVRCVVVISRAAGKQLVEFAGAGRREFLAITPKHPVYVEGEWRQPSNLVGASVNSAVQHFEHVVFNFLLERGKHTMLVGGVPCATLGHGLSNGIIEHHLFGNYDRVEELLTKCVGWEQGLVYLESGGLMALAENRADADACVRSGLHGNVMVIPVGAL